LSPPRPTAPGRPLVGRLEAWLSSPAAWLGFLALGLAYRLRQYLFAASYWYDEAFLVLAVRARGHADLLGPQPYNLVCPPVFLWASRALYLLAGDGELVLRFLPFAAGVAALLLMVPLARRAVGGPHALWAVALLAVSRHAVEHGCDVRPYTLDLFFTELILLCAFVLLGSASGRARAWAAAGLAGTALVGPWASFASPFVLGGASAALAASLWLGGAPARSWLGWAAFNGLVGLSGLGVWWFSARHMYYPGMIEHWGHNGWHGFPDWHSPADLCLWTLLRPCEVGNYGSRELGFVLTALAAVGLGSLARRAPARAVLLAGPFALAVAAGLLGKYPLAGRTAFFLLPCLWLAAVAGFGVVVEAAGRKGWRLASAGGLLVAWDLCWLLLRLASPDPGSDYRAAYAFVRENRQAGDAVWCQTGVVYQTYHGKGDPALLDGDLPLAERSVGARRTWVVVGATRDDLRRRLEDAGGRVRLRHDVSGLAVYLFEPDEAGTK
jgi:hypothetical protein